MKIISFNDIMAMEQRFRTTFINSIAGFKSLNLVGTTNDKGQTNLAVFNSTFHVGANPPYLGMVFRPDEVERHTLENILNTKQYTYNHVNPSIIHAAHQTSARYPKEISEFEAAELTPYFSKQSIAPYVLESHVKIGLEFKEKIRVNTNNTLIVIGEIFEIIIDEMAIASDGYVDLEKLETCTVAGLDAYFSVKKIERLSYAKVDQQISKIK
jgi:flavin reductase (DIM6/NTAB) family NADH-FMN oxidoreductase RutF